MVMFSEQLKKDLKNPWLRGILATVAVTVAVNVGFITYAFIFPPNLVVPDYYEQGKRYFHDQILRDKGKAVAWRLQLLAPEKVEVHKAALYRLYVMDHQGKPVRDGSVTLSAYRPDSAEDDFHLTLKRVDAGTFAGSVTFPLAGNWDLMARIDLGDKHFDTAQRIFVQK